MIAEVLLNGNNVIAAAVDDFSDILLVCLNILFTLADKGFEIRKSCNVIVKQGNGLFFLSKRRNGKCGKQKNKREQKHNELSCFFHNVISPS